MDKYIFIGRMISTLAMLIFGGFGSILLAVLFLPMDADSEILLFIDFLIFFTLPTCAILITLMYLAGKNELAFTHLTESFIIGCLSTGIFICISWFINLLPLGISIVLLLIVPQSVMLLILHIQGKIIRKKLK